MTDTNGMLKSDNSALMDDDPLAELARIVSGDSQTEPQPTPVSAPSTSVSDTSLDLEAELLGELDDAFDEPAVQDAPQTATLQEVPQAQPSAATLEATLEEELLKELIGDVDTPELEAPSEPTIEASAENTHSPLGITSITEQADISQIEDISAQIAAEPSVLAPQAVSVDSAATAELEDMFEQNFASELSGKSVADTQPQTATTEQQAAFDEDLGDVFNKSVAHMNQDQNAILNEPSFAQEAQNGEPFGAPTNLETDTHASIDPYSDPAAHLNAPQNQDPAFQAGAYAQPVTSGFEQGADYSDPALDAAFADPGSLAGEDLEGVPAEQAQSKGSGLKLAMGALVLSLIAGIAVVAWGGFGSNSQVAENIPVVPADNSPVKVKPSDPGGKKIDNTSNKVYENVNVDNKITTNQETLITAKQEPIDVEAKSALRLSPNAKEEASNNLGGVSPKRVKTLTIKPDGSIVRASDPEKVIATTKPAPIKTVPVKTIKPTAPKASVAQNTPTRITAPAKPVQVAQPVQTATQPTQIAALPAATTAPVVKSAYYVQVSSQRSQQAAQASFDNLKKRFSSVLGGKQASIQSGQVANKGTFYRAKVPAATKAEANTLCTRLKRAGGSCFVTR
ncbi:MAG: SPOR domain-containing protein [Nitratireductor sp.]